MISYRVSGTDAARLSNEFGMIVPAAKLQDLADYTMYVRTLSRGSGAGSSPSGPHYVSAYPPFERHPRHARRESVIRVSQARYAKSREIIDSELHRDFVDLYRPMRGDLSPYAVN